MVGKSRRFLRCAKKYLHFAQKTMAAGTRICVYTFVMTMFASATTAHSLSTREAQELVRQESLEIAQGLKRQDAGLLDQLIVRYQHRLLRYLLYLTSNREQAEDLFQEVWMRVLIRGGQFNGKARFDTWLFTVARNLVIDLRRKRTMSSLDEMFEAAGEEDRPMGIEVAADAPSPFDQCASAEDRDRLATALLQMEPLYREVLVLRFHEDLSLEEIANVTRAPLSTVKSRLYRGLASMKPKLSASYAS
jgi:RNA polymerase sigma-70 factor (ECF subfamily)